MRIRHFALLGLLALLLVGAIDFMRFADRVKGMQPPDPVPRVDAVVVLTGAPGRIGVALELIEDMPGRRLLVSGVHPDTTLEEMRETQGGSASIYACCVDLGREATSTRENAEETAVWVAEHYYRSVLLVTSDYHVPRSLLEFRAAMPETEFVAYPARTGLDTSRVYSDFHVFRSMLLEWAKYRIAGVFKPGPVDVPGRETAEGGAR